MKKWLLATVASLFIATLHAQTAFNEIRENILLSGSNYMAYPGRSPVGQQLYGLSGTDAAEADAGTSGL